MRVAIHLAVAAALALGACKREPPPPSNAAFLEGDPAPLHGERCAQTSPLSRPIAIEIAVVAGAGVATEQIARELAAARSYLSSYGIGLVAAPGASARIADRFLLGGSVEAINRGPRTKQAIVGEVAGPLVRLLEQRARSGGVVDVVFVERIASPRSPVRTLLTELAGLAISRMRDPRDALFSMPIPGQAPTVLISIRELERLAPGARRTVLAHEIGHVLGLAHDRDRANLMAPNRTGDCIPVLDPDQLGVIARGALYLTRQKPGGKEK